MQETMQKMIRGFMKQRTQRRRAYAAFTALAILVSITTVYTLVQPASTMEAELTCGMEEHVHTEECYAEVLICGMEEGEAEITVDPEAPVEPEVPVDPAPPAEPEAPVNPETPEVPPVEEEASSTEGEPAQEPPAVTEEPEAPTETPAEEEKESEAPVETPVEEEKENEAPAEEKETEAPAKEEKETESSAEKADSESPRESEPAGSDSEEGGTIEAVSVQNSNGPEDGEAGVHHHTAACYKKVLICGKEEHEHSSSCYESVLPEQGDMMLVLPEGAEIPDGYDREYSFIDSDNRFGVKVYAPEGALPEGAVLVAELLEEDSDAYTAAGEALEAMANGETPIVVADQSVVEQSVEKTDAEEETTVEEPVEEETPVVEEPAAEEELVEEEPVSEEPQAEEEPAEGELEASLPLYAEGPEADVTETETEEPAEAEEPAAEEEETESGFSYDGFVALDIHFEVDGKEVEPTAPVYVCINALGLLPETADPETVAVQHHAEVDKKLLGIIPVGTDTVVETVADSTEETGSIEVAENDADYTHDVMTAFAVGNFSTFTITWNGGNELQIQVIDESGTGIGSDARTNISSETNVVDIAPSIEGYAFKKAVVTSYGAEYADQYGTQILRLRRSNSRWRYSTVASGDSWSRINNSATVYFIYQTAISQSLTVNIVDTNGNPISGRAATETLQIPQNTWVSLSSKAPSVTAYTYQLSKLNGAGDDKTEVMQVFYDSTAEKWLYRTGTTGDGVELDSNEIYMLYEFGAEDVVLPTINNRKWVELNNDGTYDLNLSVSSKMGSANVKAKVDVLLIVDTSSSMTDTYVSNLNSAVNTLISAISSDSDIDAQFSRILFNNLNATDYGQYGKSSGTYVDVPWTSEADDVDDLTMSDICGGTNYQAAIMVAKEQLAVSRNGAQKIVFFITDGEPSCSVTVSSDGTRSENGEGTTVLSKYLDDAVNE